MFFDAYQSVGMAKYVGGNYGMHYFPALWATFWLDEIDNSPVRAAAAMWTAYGVYSDWGFFHDPYQVYGCTKLPAELRGTVPMLVTFVGAWLASWAAGRVPPKFKVL